MHSLKGSCTEGLCATLKLRTVTNAMSSSCLIHAHCRISTISMVLSWYRLWITSGTCPHTMGCGMWVCALRDCGKWFHDVHARHVMLFMSRPISHVRHALIPSYVNFGLYQVSEMTTRVLRHGQLDNGQSAFGLWRNASHLEHWGARMETRMPLLITSIQWWMLHLYGVLGITFRLL